ncbi:MAG: efflux RND transporter permease subunit [Chloroflexota bacterium]|nr:efflux RND transporter permease subunit [Chloroflexota bacterium]MDE2941600.1 efflux RND transporter permease subunit [Chloroflexota bacterium]MDE3267219.1 efflux RND transporter permease subunit [Chloroflexota bacterium]
MHLITGMAISRRSVTLLAIIILLISGVTAYNTLRVDLFPEIEFPLVAITAEYPGANPDAVAAEVTAPIESAISGIDQLDRIQSTTFEGNTLVLATFVFGTDMTRAESDVEAAMSSLGLPEGVERPEVGRFSPQEFPVMQLSAVSDRDLADTRALVQSTILPALNEIDGVMRVTMVGEVERRVRITVNPQRMLENSISLERISAALTDNNLSTPAGLVFDGFQAMPAKTTHTLSSVEEIADLIIGASETGPVRLSDVADVRLAAGAPRTISRTNGKPSISVSVLKEAEANTVEVTGDIRDTLDTLDLPDDVEIVIVSDQGPQIQSQIDNLRREAIFGFLFAVSVVFAFMLTIRPTVLRGLGNTLRPTIVIGLSIPLSVFTGVLLLAWQDLTLNFMTLGGLAISVGRVVDDSIVVLENVYRHIQAGRDRWKAALDATTEVGPAIFASTLTTVVVFAPLGFIQGLVGAFFLPFALTVTFALLASLVVALTAVPVLGAYLVRPGDLTGAALEDENGVIIQETWMQRAYTPALRWVLRHKAVTLAGVFLLTASSPALLAVIPITFLPSGGDRSLTMELSAPPGTPLDATIEQVEEIEARVAQISDLYVATIGSSAFGPRAGPGGLNEASFLVNLPRDAPEDIADTLRDELEQPGRTLRIAEVSAGPPSSGVDISITGSNYDDIVNTAEQLVAAITPIEGIENLESNVAQARDEVSILVDPQKAGAIGLSTRQIGLQLSQYLTGRTITTIVLDGERTDVTLAADPRFVAGLDRLRQLTITGPGGAARLGDLASVEVREGPVVISRTDGQRSATITADITSDDTQRVGRLIDQEIDTVDDDPNINIVSGGIFADIAEGFRAIFISMAVGIVLVYLVMVVSLGSLRNPLVIVTSLPLALIGVLVALAVTGHSLGIAAMMGVLLLIGIVVTNAIVLITFVEQLRARGLSVYEALITGGRVRLRPILMTALTTSFALVPLAATAQEGGIVSAELATVVIGGLASSTFLTLFVVPIVYALFNDSIPGLFRRGRVDAQEETPETA